ncbi:MAG: hypothetical protein GXP30_00785 [Verrucomicrobia bacterium]|nr:hypothetical protein [Verrucomicrobiota bacterium]
MAYGLGSRLVSNLERKFGHLALPNLLHWVAGFQFLVFVLSVIDPNYMSLISFSRDAIFSGQVWRLFTYLFFPQTMNIYWILISIYFLWFISSGLESEWGSFRVNLYLFFTMFCLTSIALLLPPFFVGNGSLLATLVFANVFFAFARIYPDQQILLMMIIPIKVKYLGWVVAGTLLVKFLKAPLLGIVIFPGLLPFLLVFGPDFIRSASERGKAASRRANFQAASHDPDKETFHTCNTCGTDDVAAPDLEFRVAADGDEYCTPCLEQMRRENETVSESKSA